MHRHSGLGVSAGPRGVCNLNLERQIRTRNASCQPPSRSLVQRTSSIRLPVTTNLTGSVFFHVDFGITSCHSAPR